MSGIRVALEKSWKIAIIVAFFLLLSFLTFKYWRLFASISSTSIWPDRENTLVFYADVFTSPFTKRGGLFFLNLDDKELIYWDSIMTSSNDYATVSWVSQKQQLLFNGSIDSVYGLYFVDKDGDVENIETIALFSSIDHSISSDGRFIAFVHEEELYIQDIEGIVQQRLTHNDDIDREPNWSPDGQELIFRTYRQEEDFSAIIRINKDGTDPRLLTKSPNPLNNPVWSPDGSMIAFKESNQRSRHSLWVMNANGSDIHQILKPDSDGDTIQDFAWSPDSKYIAFVSSRNGYCGMKIGYQTICSRSIYLIDVNTGNVTRLTNRWLLYTSLAWAN